MEHGFIFITVFGLLAMSLMFSFLGGAVSSGRTGEGISVKRRVINALILAVIPIALSLIFKDAIISAVFA